MLVHNRQRLCLYLLNVDARRGTPPPLDVSRSAGLALSAAVSPYPIIERLLTAPMKLFVCYGPILVAQSSTKMGLSPSFAYNKTLAVFFAVAEEKV